MTDDPKSLAAEARALADRLARLEIGGDIIDLILRGELLTTSQAADGCQRDQDTIARWFKAAAAEGRPLGVQLARYLLIGKERLLDYVGEEFGDLARKVAEVRLAKYASAWSQPPELGEKAKRASEPAPPAARP
jgi:hypothetical protein